jgi:nucleotide-binding universal stress UspA family protein
MNMPTILVPLDGSTFAECVLPYAMELAHKLSCAIELVGVAPMIRTDRGWPAVPVFGGVPHGIDPVQSDYLRATATKVEAVSSAQVLCTMLSGPPARELVKHSNNHRPELMILSTNGGEPLRQAWLGSVAERVARHVPMPVLLVRPKATAGSNLTERCRFDHIMVALDGSPQGEAGLHWAKAFGGVDTAYTLVCVEPTAAPPRAPELELAPLYPSDSSRAGHTEAAEYLCGVENRVMNRIQNVTSVVLKRLPVALGILKAAEQNAADLIIITTDGLSGLPRLLMGTVADGYVRASNVPVLMVRPELTGNTRFSVPREVNSMALRH